MGTHLESEFTSPRPDCPHPEWWHAYDSMAAEVEVIEFLGGLIRALQPELVVETGTWKGHAARAIGKTLVHIGHGRLITLEIDADLAREAEESLSGLPVRVENVDSMQYTPPGSIDLLWLDGSTDRAGEWNHLSQFMSPYGIVVVHDTGPHGDARAAFDALDNITLIHLATPRGVSIGQKR